MRKILFVLAIAFSFCQIQAKEIPCKECRGKYSQKTTDIFWGVYDGETYHIAFYLGGFIETLLTGEEAGTQTIYLAQDPVSQSKYIEWRSESEFIHHYERYDICSSAKGQWIKWRKNEK